MYLVLLSEKVVLHIRTEERLIRFENTHLVSLRCAKATVAEKIGNIDRSTSIAKCAGNCFVFLYLGSSAAFDLPLPCALPKHPW